MSRSGMRPRSSPPPPAAGPVGWQSVPALLARDVLMPAIWVGAFTGRSFTWKGTAMQMEERRDRRPVAPETERA